MELMELMLPLLKIRALVVLAGLLLELQKLSPISSKGKNYILIYLNNKW